MAPYQVLAYADDENLIGDDIRTIERNADVLLNACKDIGLAVNSTQNVFQHVLTNTSTASEDTKCISTCVDQNLPCQRGQKMHLYVC